MSEWTEGVCGDGAAILRDGEMVPISELLTILNANADLLAALEGVVADIAEYERVNNLYPSPGKSECWQSVTQARAAIAKARGAM